MSGKNEERRYRRYYRAIEEAAQKPQTKVYSGAVFSFLTVSLFGLYAILPTTRTVLFLRREIADKTRVNQQMEEKITSLIEVQAAYEEAGDSVFLVDQALPPVPQAVELASQLRSLAAISQASISAIQISAVPLVGEQKTGGASSQAKQSEFSVNVTLVGSFTTLRSFLDGLGTMRRIVTLESLRITPATGQQRTSATGGTVLQLVLQLKAYWHG